MGDLLIKNGKLVSGETIDISILNGKIHRIGKKLEEKAHKEIIDLKGDYVSAGWIDSYSRCLKKKRAIGDYFLDHKGYKKGITTLIDIGTVGSNNIEEGKKLIRNNKTNIYFLINLYKDGTPSDEEFSDLNNIDLELTEKLIKENKDTIVGIKSKTTNSTLGKNGVIPFILANVLKRKTNLPLMIEIKCKVMEFEEVIDLLDENDIVSNVFRSGEDVLFNDAGLVKKEVKEAIKRGVKFHLKYGNEGLEIKGIKKALKKGVKFNIISVDEDIDKIEPTYGNKLCKIGSNLINIGYSLEDVIHGITKNPADILNLKGKGYIKEGYDGDLTIFNLSDNEEGKLLEVKGVVIMGEYERIKR